MSPIVIWEQMFQIGDVLFPSLQTIVPRFCLYNLKADITNLIATTQLAAMLEMFCIEIVTDKICLGVS